jgi:hypothetical protein
MVNWYAKKADQLHKSTPLNAAQAVHLNKHLPKDDQSADRAELYPRA